LDSEDVVVGREHGKGWVARSWQSDRNLRVVDSGEVASTSWLMFFWLERKGIRVDTWGWATRVVVEWLDLVEVFAALGLHSVLAVEDQLEIGELVTGLFRESWRIWTLQDNWRTQFRSRHSNIRNSVSECIASGNWAGSCKVPQEGVRRVSFSFLNAPHQFLDWVIVRQSDLLGTSGNGIGASVLHLLDQVFVTLLRESSAFFGVEVDVVTPDLESGTISVLSPFVGQVKVQSDFVVLQGNQWQRQSWVAVEEKDEWQINRRVITSSHLTPVSLLGFIQVQFRVQSPPSLVVLVNALTTNRQFNILDRTFRDPAAIRGSAILGTRGQGLSFHFDVHVSDQITISRDRDRKTTRVTGSTVNSLFDVFHREVGVAFVNRLEKSYFWVTCKVDILGAIGDELHETTGHI